MIHFSENTKSLNVKRVVKSIKSDKLWDGVIWIYSRR